MELKKFKLVATRNAIWRGKEVPKGTAVLVLAGESADDVTWFFSKIEFSAWALEAIDEPAKSTGKKP